MPALPDEMLVLRRKPRIRGWNALAWRLSVLVSLIGLLVLFHWLERAGLKDLHDGEVSFLDAIYFTMISATTTGYGDIVPVSNTTRMFDALVVTPIRIIFLLILAGTAYRFVAQRSWEKFRMSRIQRKLCDHIVVMGYGVKSSRAVQELLETGAEPHDIVVVDMDEERLAKAKAIGCTVLKADATQDETLKAVQVDRAKLVIISAGRDDTSVLICLSVRHLAPDVTISVAVNRQDNEVPARRAGANVVVNPLDFAGLLLAASNSGQHIADYLGDLASMKGKVRLIERKVRPEEVGKPLNYSLESLGLRLIREGTPYGFWRPQAQKLETGDIIMEVCPTVQENC